MKDYEKKRLAFANKEMSRPAEEGAPSARRVQTEVSGYQTVTVKKGFSSWGERQSRKPTGPFQV